MPSSLHVADGRNPGLEAGFDRVLVDAHEGRLAARARTQVEPPPGISTCNGGFDHYAGVTEIPEYRILPDAAAQTSLTDFQSFRRTREVAKGLGRSSFRTDC